MTDAEWDQMVNQYRYDLIESGADPDRIASMLSDLNPVIPALKRLWEVVTRADAEAGPIGVARLFFAWQSFAPSVYDQGWMAAYGLEQLRLMRMERGADAELADRVMGPLEDLVLHKMAREDGDDE